MQQGHFEYCFLEADEKSPNFHLKLCEMPAIEK